MTTQPLPEPVILSEGKYGSPPSSGKSTHRANNWMLAGFITVFLGAAIGVIGKKLMHDEVVTVVGVLMSLVGMFLIVYPHLMPARGKRDAIAASQPEQLMPSQSPTRLPGESPTEYVPSITERTTDLLSVGARPTEEQEPDP